MRSFRHPREILNPVSKRLQLGADIGQMAIAKLIREQIHILTTRDARQLRVLFWSALDLKFDCQDEGSDKWFIHQVWENPGLG